MKEREGDPLPDPFPLNAATGDEGFLAFMALGCDRLVRLSGMLARRGLEGRVLSLGTHRHLLVRLGSGLPSLLLVAHYDRVEGSPGALDNSAACYVLAEAGARIREDPEARKGTFLLFTDGEEAPALGSPLSQGSYALATGLKRVFGEARPGIFVFDVVGRGTSLVMSTSARTSIEGPGRPMGAMLDALESSVAEVSARIGLRRPLRLPLPWSDDLGFTLAGMPSLVLSLLPAVEADALLRGLARASSAAAPRLPGKEELGEAWPRTWERLHGPLDGPELLEKASLDLMVEFCVDLCRVHPSRTGA